MQGIHGRRGVPPEARLEAPAPWRTIDSAQTLAITSLYLGKAHPHSRSSRIPQIPQGAAFLPGGQLERPLPWPELIGNEDFRL